MGSLLSGRDSQLAVSDGDGGDGTVSRRLVVGVLVFAIGWIAVAALVPPHSRWLTSILAIVPMPVGLAVLAAALKSTRTAQHVTGFVVREGVGFAVPASRNFGYFLTSQTALFGLLGNRAILQWTRFGDNSDDFLVVDRTFTIVMTVCLGVMLVPMSLLLVNALRGTPRIELTPGGVTVRGGPSRSIPWEAFRPGFPLQPADRSTLTLTLDRPELVVQHGLKWRVPLTPKISLGYARVHPGFLADVIRFYVDRPDRRPAIGTSAEYQRLLAELAVPASTGTASESA